MTSCPLIFQRLKGWWKGGWARREVYVKGEAASVGFDNRGVYISHQIIVIVECLTPIAFN